MRDLATHQILTEYYGRPRLLQSMALTANTSNKSAELPKGARLMVQCGSNTIYMKIGDSTVSVATPSFAEGAIYIVNGDKYLFCLKDNDSYLAFNTAGAGVVVNIFVME